MRVQHTVSMSWQQNLLYCSLHMCRGLLLQRGTFHVSASGAACAIVRKDMLR